MTEQEILSEVSDLINLDPKKFQKLIEKDTRGNLQMRVHALATYKNKMPQQGLETPEERIQKKARLDQLIAILQSEIRKKETEQGKTQFENEKRWVENTLVEQLPNLRSSSENAINRMQREGTMGVPLDVPQWQRLTSTTIEVKCQSGKTRKLDLKKLNPQVLRNLLEAPFRPMFFVMEGEGMISKQGEPVTLWSDQGNYATVASQRQVQRTVLALMWVG